MRRRAVSISTTSSSSDSDSGPAFSPSDKATLKVNDEDHARFTFLDLLQILGGLVLFSSVLSFFVTNSSFTWNYRPTWTRSGVMKAWLRGPITLTPDELAIYNGTDTGLPIYVAVNGTIFDVSASPAFYGPGGSYHFFAGRDATRAFVTGCFHEDLTPDLRGVEEMFMPVDPDDRHGRDGHPDDPVGADKESTAERKKRREQEKRTARKKVTEAVAHWERFFARNDKYFKVGIVKRQDGWIDRLPQRKLCEAARKARPSRSQ